MEVKELIEALQKAIEEKQIEENAITISKDGAPIIGINVLNEDIYISSDKTTIGTKDQLVDQGHIVGMTKLYDKGTVMIY